MATTDRSSKTTRRGVKKFKKKRIKSSTLKQKREENRSLAKQMGERLVAARRSRGLSQLDLAVTCEVTRAAVSQWERGGTMADGVNIRKMANKLDVPVEWIETGANPPKLEAPLGHTRVVRRRQHEIEKPPFNGAVAEMEAGIGLSSSFGTEEAMRDWWRLPPHFIDLLGVDSNNLRAYRIVRENIRGFSKQDVVFVDITQTEPIDGCLYVVDMEVGLLLKKATIDLDDPTMVTLSDRSGERSIRIKASRKDPLKILGRCILHAAIL